MTKFIILKTDQSTNEIEAFTTLQGALRSAGIEPLYRVARSQIKRTNKFEYLQYVFRNIKLTHKIQWNREQNKPKNLM